MHVKMLLPRGHLRHGEVADAGAGHELEGRLEYQTYGNVAYPVFQELNLSRTPHRSDRRKRKCRGKHESSSLNSSKRSSSKHHG